MKYITFIFFCVLSEAWFSSCSCNSTKPDCCYIPSERILFIDDGKYEIVALCINIYDKPDMVGNFESVEFQFKENECVQTIDFDHIDTSLIKNCDIESIRKIEEAKSISIPFIYINKVIEKSSINEIRAFVNIDRSRPITKCEVVRL